MTHGYIQPQSQCSSPSPNISWMAGKQTWRTSNNARQRNLPLFFLLIQSDETQWAIQNHWEWVALFAFEFLSNEKRVLEKCLLVECYISAHWVTRSYQATCQDQTQDMVYAICFTLHTIYCFIFSLLDIYNLSSAKEICPTKQIIYKRRQNKVCSLFPKTKEMQYVWKSYGVAFNKPVKLK